MKTPEQIIEWCDMMLTRRPNVEDQNFFNSIKYYMQTEIDRVDLATKCTVLLDSFRENKE